MSQVLGVHKIYNINHLVQISPLCCTQIVHEAEQLLHRVMLQHYHQPITVKKKSQGEQSLHRLMLQHCHKHLRYIRVSQPALPSGFAFCMPFETHS